MGASMLAIVLLMRSSADAAPPAPEPHHHHGESWSGDLTGEASAAEDELGRLARSFNRMLRRIQQTSTVSSKKKWHRPRLTCVI